MKCLAALAAVLLLAAAAGDARRSGFEFMSPATQALQRDDTQNPAMLWRKDGEQRFRDQCARCHDVAALRSAGARYPEFDAASARPVTLGMRINLCRARYLKQPPWPSEDDALLGLETYVASLARGMPIAPTADDRLAPFRERGRRLYAQRIGQLDFSCADCHDRHAGGHLGASPIPEAHPTGYPIYRLEWQAVGSLERRLRNCMTGVRAEPFAYGSDELVDIELYLMQRAAGMTVETPAVRP